MSAYYSIYMGLRKKKTGKIVRIDPFIKTKDGEFEQTATFFNGSRDYFSNTWDELCEIEDFEVRKESLDEFQDASEFFSLERLENHDIAAIVVDYEKFLSQVPAKDRFEHVGFAKPGYLEEDFDEYDAKNPAFLSPIQYSQLADEAKRCYTYIEYDDDYSWKYWFKIVKEKVLNTIGLWERVNKYYWYNDMEDYEYVMVCVLS